MLCCALLHGWGAVLCRAVAVSVIVLCHGSCRTQLLRSLPKLDGTTAAQLTNFLAELQQRRTGAASGQEGHSNGSTLAALDAATQEPHHVAVTQQQELWWQQAEVAFALLKQEAQVQQGSEQQTQEAEHGA